MDYNTLCEKIKTGAYDEKFTALYGDNAILPARARYLAAIEGFHDLYGKRDISIISVPGRSEILGNHTDHNRGCVLAAAINLDVIAIVSKSLIPGGRKSNVRIKSEGFPADEVVLDTLAPKADEVSTSASIIRGTLARFEELGYEIGGFDAYTTSNVLKGSGLSSSAAFEVLVGYTLSVLYNNNKIPAIELAKIGQYAENKYFGKPCGLMDQTACASGGFVSIDFKNPAEPVVEKLDYELTKHGYALCIVSTGGSHENLSGEYAAIRGEMESVAAFFGREVLRDVDKKDFYANIAAIREKCGDRAILRAIHYFNENARVKNGTEALREGVFNSFLSCVISSGNSSFKYLQNMYSNSRPSTQGISLALALSKELLVGKNAGIRVHGGGFAGTILAFIPKKFCPGYITEMEAVFGKGSCMELFVRSEGACLVC